MVSDYLARQLSTAALTANALHPPHSYRTMLPSYLAGWLTGELAPQLLGLTVADTLRELRSRRRSPLGLALAGASALGLAAVVRESTQARGRLDSALRDGLGADYLDRLSQTYADVDLGTPLGQLLWPLVPESDEVEVIRDVVYDDRHGRRGLLDVYRQRGAKEPGPVLVQVPGGGWTIGSKDRQARPLMHHMAARGWVCLAVNYRLSPRDPFPAQIVDVKRALAWARGHAHEYGGDPAFLAVTGGSAGGHLTALAAFTRHDRTFQPGFEDADTHVDAAVPLYGVYDFAGVTSPRAQEMRDRFLGPRVLRQDPRAHPAAFAAASPILRITAQAPPTMVVHGDRDSLVEVEQARRLVAVLRETSRREVVYAELPGAQHAFDYFPSIRTAALVRGVERFLRWAYDEAVTAAALDTSQG